jgi:hypothetical protein
VQTRVLIGPFRRRVFAEGLAALLKDEPDLEVSLLDHEQDAAGLMASTTPLIVILESRDGEGGFSPFLPKSDAVAVILISQASQDLQIALKQVDRSRLRAAIGLVSQVPHPRMISLDLDRPSQAPFGLPHFRRSETSGLAHAVGWLDACFAVALSDLAAARGREAPGWLSDLEHLLRAFTGGRTITPHDEDERFETFMRAPGWHATLTQAFALDPQEIKLLCFAGAPDLDQRYAQAIGILQNDYAAPRPNATTLALLLGPDNIGADITALMSGRRSFARLAMIRAEDAAAPQPGYRLAPDLLALMIGVRRRTGPGWRLQCTALPAQDDLTAQIARILDVPGPPVIMVAGEGTDIAEEVAAAVVRCGSRVLRADCAGLGEGDIERAVFDRALIARLTGAVLMLENFETLTEAQRARIFGADIAGLVPATIVIGGASALGVAHDALAIRVRKPAASTVAKRWQAAASDHGLDLSGAEVRRLGGTLRLRAGDIEAVARLAAGRRRVGTDATEETLILDAARSIAAQHSPETVRRAAALFGWDDIILPGPIKAQVTKIPEHVRHAALVLDDWGFAARLPYGRGVGALFSGPSGTGKTMCAQVIAHALGAELMQVEISRCVSKYIGETEKNIDRCFAAAEAASAVLLFDESDALFGKRTEIKDAHDRHANVEVAYLLQRIEAYEGLVILTTNFKTNIDPAFLRRLRFVVDFPMPDAADRERIWQVGIPKAAPCAADVDTVFLARRLPLSGGSIQSIAVNAAFGAAAEGCAEIHMRHIMAATRAELLKNGMLSAEHALTDPERRAAEGICT